MSEKLLTLLLYFDFTVNGNLKSLLISKTELLKLLDMELVLKVVEEVLKEHAKSRVIMPPKISIELSKEGVVEYDSHFHVMPAYVKLYDQLGAKLIGAFPARKFMGRSLISGIIILINPITGEIESIMDGSYITYIRTAALCLIGAKYLAPPKPRKLAIIGAGELGKHTLLAFSSYYTSLEKVTVFNRSWEKGVKYMDEMKNKVKLEIDLAETLEKATKDADIIITVTTAKAPLVRSEHIGEGMLLCAIGSYQEYSEDCVLKCDKIVVDDLEQAKFRGSLAPLFKQSLLTDKDIYADLSAIVSGKLKGRENDEEIIFFESLGIGSVDIAVAYYAYMKAKEYDLGESFSFE